MIVVDTEFRTAPGEPVVPVCLAWTSEDDEGTIWLEDQNVPYPFGKQHIVVFNGAAEGSVFKAMGWDVKVPVIDLYVESINKMNGLEADFLKETGSKSVALLACCKRYGIDTMESEEKKSNIGVILRGGYSKDEKDRILNYCLEDTHVTFNLWKAMEHEINTSEAFLRGQYMMTMADVVHRGIPIDVETYEALVSNWSNIQAGFIEKMDELGFYDAGHFVNQRFTDYIQDRGYNWPVVASGKQYSLAEDDIKGLGAVYPDLKSFITLHQLLPKLAKLQMNIGRDGRARSNQWPFGTVTGRNTPRGDHVYTFDASMRSLIQPKPGMALSYVDFSAQEFYLAAVLSGDSAMMADYETGDPHFELAKSLGLIPPHVKKSDSDYKDAGWKALRDLAKAINHGLNYGKGFEALARDINRSQQEAKKFIRTRQKKYQVFADWLDNEIQYAIEVRGIETRFGWQYRLGNTGRSKLKHGKLVVRPHASTLKNWIMQANGAELTRNASVKVMAAGIGICAVVHDALLVEDTIDNIDVTAKRTQTIMEQTSTAMFGATCRADIEYIIKHPDCYHDARGTKTWAKLMESLEEHRGRKL